LGWLRRRHDHVDRMEEEEEEEEQSRVLVVEI